MRSKLAKIDFINTILIASILFFACLLLRSYLVSDWRNVIVRMELTMVSLLGLVGKLIIDKKLNNTPDE